MAAPEARGFLFGPAVAKALGVAFLPIRKAGQLPASVHESDAVAMDYGAEMRGDTGRYGEKGERRVWASRYGVMRCLQLRRVEGGGGGGSFHT